MGLLEYSQLATIITVFVSLGMIAVAYKQLSGVRTELKMNSLMAVLELEAEMNTRKEKFDLVAFNIRKLSEEDKLTDTLKDILSDERKCALENYLNSIDRLAYCIIKDYLKDRDWRVEYRDYIQNIIRDNESAFGEGSRYRNIKDINDKWQRN